MFLNKKSYLREINRIRVSEGRDLVNGIRLDRNEKVDNWPEDFMFKVLESKPRSFFSTYPDTSSLYKKLAVHLNVNEQQLLLSSGIDGVIKTIFEILVEPGDKIGVLSPTYAMYDVYAKLFQAENIHVGYNEDFSVDWESFANFLKQEPVVFFMPNPNQPIESCFSIDEMRTIAQRCLDVKCLFIVDEAYHYFGADSALPLIDEFKNVVVMRTFSKAFGIPSARLGYMVSSLENMNLLSKTRFAHEANAISAAMAEYLLDNFIIVEEYAAKINDSRSFVKQQLQRIGINAHGNKGNYLLIDLKNEEQARSVVNNLRENKIYVKGPWSEPWNRYITITLGPKDVMEAFVNKVNELNLVGV